MDRAEIDRFVSGGADLKRAVEGLTPDDLAAYPIPNTWSIQEIVWHMYDSDSIGCDRMKRIIAEDRPLLLGYDETKFAKNLFYGERDIAAAVDTFALVRQMMGDLLVRLPAEAFFRTGVHSENGIVELGTMVKKYTEHLKGHLVHLHRKRGMLGKPIA